MITGVTWPRGAAFISACDKRPDVMPRVSREQYVRGVLRTDVFITFAMPCRVARGLRAMLRVQVFTKSLRRA